MAQGRTACRESHLLERGLKGNQGRCRCWHIQQHLDDKHRPCTHLCIDTHVHTNGQTHAPRCLCMHALTWILTSAWMCTQTSTHIQSCTFSNTQICTHSQVFSLQACAHTQIQFYLQTHVLINPGCAHIPTEPHTQHGITHREWKCKPGYCPGLCRKWGRGASDVAFLFPAEPCLSSEG